ncbi:MAG TPA: hypothetical protein DEF45_12965, partial [Rhodopirellula sp.]|nr:hypothetical protein [Rhodopirellula sp.]
MPSSAKRILFHAVPFAAFTLTLCAGLSAQDATAKTGENAAALEPAEEKPAASTNDTEKQAAEK